MKPFLQEARTALVLTAVFAIVLCGAYPLAVWAGAQALFPRQANGSLVVDATGAVRGSSLLAQNFSSDKYFQSRPSAAGTGYDATSSGGTNLGPTSKKLADAIGAAVTAYRSSNGLTPDTPVPADAVTSSGSGLDPDISVQNANIQAARVARVRGISPAQLHQIIAAHTSDRDLHLFGEPRVNVLLLNLSLDRGVK